MFIGSLIHSRQADLECRTPVDFAVNPDATTALPDDIVNRRQSEAGALANLFGREEGLEYAWFALVVNAAAGVADGNHDVIAGWNADVRANVVFFEPDVVRFNRQAATVRHCVARVKDKV